MNIQAKKGSVTQVPCDLLAIGIIEEAKRLEGAASEVDAATSGFLSRTLADLAFRGKMGSIIIVQAPEGFSATRLALVGLGKAASITLETSRLACASAIDAAKGWRAKTVAIPLIGLQKGTGAKLVAKAMTEGVRLAAYRFCRYKKDENESKLETVLFLVANGNELKQAEVGVEQGELAARGTMFARDLVNTPSFHMTPAELVQVAKGLVKEKGRITLAVHDKKQLKEMGAGGILGVSQGSDHDPFLAHLVYQPKVKAKKRVALVGKALTFDSGGLSLKPADSMMTMKCDMAGAAAVLGLFSVIEDLAPDVEVHGIFAACENMPSGKAIRPGDILTLMNGKTLEILNTDAEGRVTLADALTYAVKQDPTVIIDLATLTGACMVALGEEITGLMSNHPALAEKVKRAASEAGELVWELPLEKRYKKEIESEIADYKNIPGTRYGGALTAGLLLEEFVEGKPWAHLDIAGPSFAEKPMNAYTKKGGTGHGVRTLIEYLRGL